MFTACLNRTFALMCNLYKSKIQFPNTGGAFVHNDLNWFNYYKRHLAGEDVDAVQTPQMVVFLTDTVPGKCEFLITNVLYKPENWVNLMEVVSTNCTTGVFMVTVLTLVNRSCTQSIRSSSRVTRQWTYQSCTPSYCCICNLSMPRQEMS